jgi:hypothetical protein
MLNDILQMQQFQKLLYHFKGSGIKSVTISFIAAVVFRQAAVQDVQADCVNL